ASAAAGEGALRCARRGDEEHTALGHRLTQEAGEMAGLSAGQDSFLAGGERAAALIHVLRAAQVLDDELETMLMVAARGFRRAVTPATEAIYRARVDALDARLV
ncbi:MAG TPA: hypothetical protein VJQ08_08910, partial [Candidatus Dormibacteraeota bacterium]|nr:hypothetical protein [Candidatus Dormibacteraeota bacterium]